MNSESAALVAREDSQTHGDRVMRSNEIITVGDEATKMKKGR